MIFFEVKPEQLKELVSHKDETYIKCTNDIFFEMMDALDEYYAIDSPEEVIMDMCTEEGYFNEEGVFFCFWTPTQEWAIAIEPKRIKLRGGQVSTNGVKGTCYISLKDTKIGKLYPREVYKKLTKIPSEVLQQKPDFFIDYSQPIDR